MPVSLLSAGTLCIKDEAHPKPVSEDNRQAKRELKPSYPALGSRCHRSAIGTSRWSLRGILVFVVFQTCGWVNVLSEALIFPFPLCLSAGGGAGGERRPT